MIIKIQTFAFYLNMLERISNKLAEFHSADDSTQQSCMGSTRYYTPLN